MSELGLVVLLISLLLIEGRRMEVEGEKGVLESFSGQGKSSQARKSGV